MPAPSSRQNSHIPNPLENLALDLDGTLKRGGIPVAGVNVVGAMSADSIEFHAKHGQRIATRSIDLYASGSVNTISTRDYIVGINSSLGVAPTIGLPDATKVGQGKSYIIKDEVGEAGTTTITIRSTGERNIDGSATTTITSNYGAARLYSDGSNWFSW